MFKLLIAEDEVLEREAIKYIIDKNFPECFEIREAENGREAIALAGQFLPDLLFLDIKMPGCNGIEAAQAIRKIDPECRIIILSAYHQFNYAQSAISFGADEYLTKPASPAKIVETLTRVLKTLDATRLKKIRDAETNRRQEQISKYLQDEFLIRVALDEMGTEPEKTLESLDELLDWLETAYSGETVILKEKVYELLLGLTHKITLNTGLDDFTIDADSLYHAIFRLKSLAEVRTYAKNFVTERICEIGRIKKSRANALITIVSDYLEQNYAREISLDDVAAFVQISSFYLSKLFKKELGENFIDYLTKIRIRKAKEILVDPRNTVKDACYRVGYRDPNYFARVFKKISGMTPTEYQSKYMQ